MNARDLEIVLTRGAVALSAIFPLDDENLLSGILDLRAELPTTMDLVVGGRAAEQHAARLRPAGVEYMAGFGELRRRLREIAGGG